MTPEESELLMRSIKLAEENNKILRGMRRRAKIATYFRIFYWVIILATIFSTYYALLPFLNPLINIIKGGSGVNNIKSITENIPDLPDWLDNK